MAFRMGCRLMDRRFQLTEKARVYNGGERLVIKDWQRARESGGYIAFCHIQRYEWVSSILQGKRCLDAGCGSGYGTDFLARQGEREMVGIDISEKAIKYAAKKYGVTGVEFITMDVREMRLEDHSFDAVISFDVMEHLSAHDQGRFLAEVVRVITQDGSAFIGCPNATMNKLTNPFHIRELNVHEFKELLHLFFEEVGVLGQDIAIPGFTSRADWRDHLQEITFADMVLVEDELDNALCLLAICRKPRATARGNGAPVIPEHAIYDT